MGEKIPDNFNFQGAGLFIPFLEKFKLYQEFFSSGNMWDSKKKQYWRHEKAILQWAYSNKHQHLGSQLTTDTFKREYGVDQYEASGIQLLSKRSFELQQEIKGNLDMIEPIMGNLVVKGLADVITRYRDVRDGDSRNYAAHSIVINRRGLVVGYLANQEEKFFRLWLFKFLKLFIGLVAVTLFVSIGFLALNQIFNEDFKISISSLLVPLQNLILHPFGIPLLIIALVFIWKRL